ncbi:MULTISPECIES: alpha-aminoadipate/glutamate carrier protein LysW [Acidiplasma]|jgi:alpha-aminoadipate carrier protein LysW|uniref:alpha-aminoadipate/glutamate carrier protein LysW n=1 Tax=Acidiplasma TaxID=507753 RepID=UPI000A946256|nr:MULTISPECIES: alpha-aminoadipate/glutamate carrier protein LysW [Acidiplasma]WMT55698.1 MAG: alpha-aminoadipate/glutamate carrier protein LysW/ArgW [Acidiplasma sp.]
METKCKICGEKIQVPDDSMAGELLECPSCGMNYEITSISGNSVEIKPAENVGEDWGE